jgi:uncharacterized protein (TIGR03067 family)
MKPLLISLMLVCAPLYGTVGNAQASSDHAKLQGVWLAQSESQNGRTWSVTYQYVFQGDRLTFTDETGKETSYAFALDTASNPRLLKIRPVEAPDNATPVSVAYALDGDRLTIVVAPAGSRPTAISDKNDQELIIARRKRP